MEFINSADWESIKELVESIEVGQTVRYWTGNSSFDEITRTTQNDYTVSQKYIAGTQALVDSDVKGIVEDCELRFDTQKQRDWFKIHTSM